MHTRGLITGNSFIELQSCIPAEPVVLCAARRIEPLSSVLVKWQLSGLKYFFNDNQLNHLIVIHLLSTILYILDVTLEKLVLDQQIIP